MATLFLILPFHLNININWSNFVCLENSDLWHYIRQFTVVYIINVLRFVK